MTDSMQQIEGNHNEQQTVPSSSVARHIMEEVNGVGVEAKSELREIFQSDMENLESESPVVLQNLQAQNPAASVTSDTDALHSLESENPVVLHNLQVQNPAASVMSDDDALHGLDSEDSTSNAMVLNSGVPLDPESKHPAEKPTLEDLIATKLPLELKWKILEEYMRLWSTRIEPNYPPTNHAVLFPLRVQTPTWTDDTTEEELEELYRQNEDREYKSIGWCAIPFWDSDDDVETLLDDSEYSEHYEAGPDPKALSFPRILELTRGSKQLGHALERFFIRQMVWHILAWNNFTFDTLLGTDGRSPNFPQRLLKEFRHFSLVTGEWVRFCWILEEVFKSFTSKDCPFEEIKTLRLTTPSWPHGRNKFDAIGSREGYGLTGRIRYMVTRCYQLVQHHPHLIIHISGPSCNTYHPTLKRQAELSSSNPPKESIEELEAGRGFGFSKKEVDRFLRGSSKLLTDLRNIEFSDLDTEGEFDAKKWASRSGVHWQMKFAEEWRKIWAQGLGDGGYDAVYSYGRRGRF